MRFVVTILIIAHGEFVVDTLDGRTLFEAVVTVADQIQQASASNLTSKTYKFSVQPRS